jgi:hypothetical protein
MISKSILGAGCALLFITFGATAGTVPLNVINFNFQLADGGGGASATLNGVPVEIFCDNFADDITAPSNHQANVTTLGTSADLSDTRFGGVASNAWTTITISDGNTTLDNQDNSFFNNSASGTSALARYEMAAYLTSLYNTSLGNNTSNNQIQQAIWSILDPKADGPVTNTTGVNPDSYLEQAASWYASMNTPGNLNALNNFLSQFEIISPRMTYSNGLGVGGFQEQIAMDPVATPEPRGGIWIVLALLMGVFPVMRRTKRVAA